MIDPNNSLSNIERDSIRNRIEIVDDERMPYLEDGTPIDILLNMSGLTYWSPFTERCSKKYPSNCWNGLYMLIQLQRNLKR